MKSNRKSFRSKSNTSHWSRRRRIARIKRFFQSIANVRNRFAPVTAFVECHALLIGYSFLLGFTDISKLFLQIPLVIFIFCAATQRFAYQLVFAIFWAFGIDSINGSEMGTTFLGNIIFLLVLNATPSRFGRGRSLETLKPILIASIVACGFEMLRVGLFSFVIPSGAEFLSFLITVCILSSIFILRFVSVEIFRNQTSSGGDGAVGFNRMQVYS